MKRIKLIYLADLILFVQFVLVGGSGLIMYFNHQCWRPFLRLIHDKIGILMLVFFVAHIVLNWRWMVGYHKETLSKKDELKRENKAHIYSGFGTFRPIFISWGYRSYYVLLPPCWRSHIEFDP